MHRADIPTFAFDAEFLRAQSKRCLPPGACPESPTREQRPHIATRRCPDLPGDGDLGPAGVAVGLQLRVAEKVQPLAQYLAALPANLLFPVAVYLIVRFDLASEAVAQSADDLAAQWYILCNVIAGASAFPGDFRQAAASFPISG